MKFREFEGGGGVVEGVFRPDISRGGSRVDEVPWIRGGCSWRWSSVNSRGECSWRWLYGHMPSTTPLVILKKIFWEVVILSITAYTPDYTPVHLYADDTQFHGSCKSSDAADLAVRAMASWSSSSAPWRPGCRQIGFDWTPTRPSSSGWALATSWENAICQPTTPFCSRLMSWTILEFTWTRGSSSLLLPPASVRRSLIKESLLTLVHAFATSRVDHCNGLLFGSHSYLLDRLQSVLNSAARLVLNI